VLCFLYVKAKYINITEKTIMHFYNYFFVLAFCITLQESFGMNICDMGMITFSHIYSSNQCDKAYKVFSYAKAGKWELIDDINVCNDSGATALYIAAEENDIEMLELLVLHGADSTMQTQIGTPLHRAVFKSNKEAVEWFLTHGADSNSCYKDIASPLWHAVASGSENVYDDIVEHCPENVKKIIELLLAHGADINAHNSDGSTALDLAACEGKKALVELLLFHKADSNIEHCGWTPLQSAVSQTVKYRRMSFNSATTNFIKRYTEVVKLLIKSGARVNLPDWLKPLISGHKFAAIESLLSQYTILEKEICDKPSGATLDKVIIYGDYPELIQRLLYAGVIPTKEHLNLARMHTKSKIGNVLKVYLGIRGYYSGISKTGIKTAFDQLAVPEDIVTLIVNNVIS
jgi:ankyrin repeat protein